MAPVPKNIYDFCDLLENLDYASHQIKYVMNITFHRRHFKWKIAIPAMFSLCDWEDNDLFMATQQSVE